MKLVLDMEASERGVLRDADTLVRLRSYEELKISRSALVQFAALLWKDGTVERVDAVDVLKNGTRSPFFRERSGTPSFTLHWLTGAQRLDPDADFRERLRAAREVRETFGRRVREYHVVPAGVPMLGYKATE